MTKISKHQPIKTIGLGKPIIGDGEKLAVQRVLDSEWLTMGENVQRFEEEFAAHHGQQDAVALSSCTAGLYLALGALGIGEADEVLVPSLTFVATANAIRNCGATPVFVDIESITQPHISLKDAQSKLTKKTIAVMVVHYAGYPVDMVSWRAFADEHGLYLIEDAAHAPGADGVGVLGDITAFSFFSNKNMTTGEGGMVFAQNSEILSKLRLLRAHGMTTSTLDRDRGHAFTYDVVAVGNNYRMDELRAVIGREQLKELSNWNAIRIELLEYYRVIIEERLPEVKLTFGEGRETVAHIFTVVLPEDCHRQFVMEKLLEKGVQSSIHYPPIHRFSAYSDCRATNLGDTEAYCARTLTLPLHPSLERQDVDYVVDSLNEVLNK